MNRNQGGDQDILKKTPVERLLPRKGVQLWKIIYCFKVEIQVFRTKIGDLYYMYIEYGTQKSAFPGKIFTKNISLGTIDVRSCNVYCMWKQGAKAR